MGGFVPSRSPRIKKETPEEKEAKLEKKREQGRKLAATVNAKRWNPDYCHRGHKWTPENTYKSKGKDNVRRCRTCRAEYRKKYKKKEANENN